MVKVNPNLKKELEKYGKSDILNACFNCGVCTAICPYADESLTFPLKIIRYAQLGLEEKILQSIEPWLCYYCGECSAACPRGVDPGEMMMTIRRFLTSKYDWTGISHKIYVSKFVEVLSTLFLGFITAIIVWLLHGPIVTSRVELETFAPVHIVEISDMIIGVFLAALLLSNLYRMYRFTVVSHIGNSHIPFKRYIIEFKHVIIQFLTQLRYSACSNKKNWINHLILMWGYTTVFTLTVVFLRYYLTNEWYPITNPIRIAGYFSFIALTYATVYAIIGRIKKNEPLRKYSHPTDWMFLILLLLTAVTGILVHTFKYLNMPLATYVTFTIHLCIVVPLLVLEVPFAKWAHLAYRPFAIYFNRLVTAASSISDEKS